MPTYHLTPMLTEQTAGGLPGSLCQESCWVNADSEDEARSRVDAATWVACVSDGLKFPALRPWRDCKMTSCEIEKSPVKLPDRVIRSSSGRTFDVPEYV
jgi:hypothetical protein